MRHNPHALPTRTARDRRVFIPRLRLRAGIPTLPCSALFYPFRAAAIRFWLDVFIALVLTQLVNGVVNHSSKLLSFLVLYPAGNFHAPRRCHLWNCEPNCFHIWQ